MSLSLSLSVGVSVGVSVGASVISAGVIFKWQCQLVVSFSVPVLVSAVSVYGLGHSASASRSARLSLSSVCRSASANPSVRLSVSATTDWYGR